MLLNTILLLIYVTDLCIGRLSAELLLFQIDRLIRMGCNSGADLHGGLTEPGLLVGIDAFLGAGGALRSVEGFKAAAQAGVAEVAVAAAIAWELVNYVAYLSRILIDMDLPRIAEAVTGKPGSGDDWRQF